MLPTSERVSNNDQTEVKRREIIREIKTIPMLKRYHRLEFEKIREIKNNHLKQISKYKISTFKFESRKTVQIPSIIGWVPQEVEQHFDLIFFKVILKVDNFVLESPFKTNIFSTSWSFSRPI